ncbi:DUF4870 domain-containing protein [Lentisphaerota bacterium ZTH]|nr:DUF4870 domain-containing protein [Lentisphaerota bacterium]WET05389.1 DUF4870 domain-containing protein [Lentisphaerota bacterium ZTH]
MSIAEEVKKLQELKESGALTEEEFQQAKTALLKENDKKAEKAGKSINLSSVDVNTWGMFIHLSQLLGLILPILGFIVPFLLWQLKKNDSEIIDTHGRIVANWIISALIYTFVASILCVIFIGFPLLFAIVILGIVFPVIGAVKANNGEAWPYPLSIRFFHVSRIINVKPGNLNGK